jgi:vitamin B12 dependent methionine synthase, activation domain
MTKTALHIDEIKKEKIIHYGIQRNISEMDGTAIDKAITCILDFAEPRGLYEELPYDIPSHTFLGRQPFGVEGVQILPFLKQAEIIVAMTATLGKKVDAAIDNLFLEQKFTEGMILDCTAAAALESLLNKLTEIIDITYSRDELKTAWRVCPGEGDFPLSQQVSILTALDSTKIGITVSKSRMIEPRKTITALSGLRSLQKMCNGSCGGCSMSGHCGDEDDI